MQKWRTEIRLLQQKYIGFLFCWCEKKMLTWSYAAAATNFHNSCFRTFYQCTVRPDSSSCEYSNRNKNSCFVSFSFLDIPLAWINFRVNWLIFDDQLKISHIETQKWRKLSSDKDYTVFILFIFHQSHYYVMFVEKFKIIYIFSTYIIICRKNIYIKHGQWN